MLGAKAYNHRGCVSFTYLQTLQIYKVFPHTLYCLLDLGKHSKLKSSQNGFQTRQSESAMQLMGPPNHLHSQHLMCLPTRPNTQHITSSPSGFLTRHYIQLDRRCLGLVNRSPSCHKFQEMTMMKIFLWVSTRVFRIDRVESF